MPAAPIIGAFMWIFGTALHIIDLIVCFMVFTIALLMIAHRLLWPFLERLVHALQRYRIMREKKLLCGIGITLMTLPTHTAAGVVTFLIDNYLSG